VGSQISLIIYEYIAEPAPTLVINAVLISQYGSVKVVSLSISQEPRLGGFSPTPPIGGRLRPPNPLQKIVLFYV
jgi:hypothetical protein